MSTTEPTPPPLPPFVPAQPARNTTMALVVYILYIISYATGGVTALAGLIIAYVAETNDPMLASHYRFQIRTFWIGLLYMVVGIILCFVIVGFAVLLWWFIWSLIRVIKGVMLLSENRPIANPGSWMFGSA